MEKGVVLKNNESDKLKEHFAKITLPIFNKVLKETTKNHMLVGKVGSKNKKYCLYNPHNFRAYFEYNRITFNINNNKKTNVEIGLVSFKKINSTEYIFTNFLDCTIRVKKNQIEIRDNIQSWHKIFITTNCEKEFLKIISPRVNNLKKVLKTFIKIYGGTSNYNLLNIYSEEKIKNEDFIDTLPIKSKFHNKIGKKVYNESNFEFGNTAFASNYISNSAVKEIAPEIANALNNLTLELKKKDLLTYLKNNIRTMHDFLTTYKKDIENLSPDDNKLFNEWIYSITFPRDKPKINTKKEIKLITDLELKKKDSLKFITSNVKTLDDLFKHANLVKKLNISEKKELELWLFEKFNTGVVNNV